MSSQPARPPRLHWRIDDHAGRRYAGAVLSVMEAAQRHCKFVAGGAPAERYRADAPVTIPARCGTARDALVDAARLMTSWSGSLRSSCGLACTAAALSPVDTSREVT